MIPSISAAFAANAHLLEVHACARTVALRVSSQGNPIRFPNYGREGVQAPGAILHTLGLGVVRGQEIPPLPVEFAMDFSARKDQVERSKRR
jgi:hypothetical protein